MIMGLFIHAQSQMASQELAYQVLGFELALVVGNSLKLVGFHLEVLHLAHHELEGLHLVLQLLFSHLFLLWLDLLCLLFLFRCTQDIIQDLTCFLQRLFLVVVVQYFSFDMRPRGSLHEFQQVEEIPILIYISQQTSLHPLWWTFAQRLEIFLDDFDEVVDLVPDFVLVGPSQLPVFGVDYEYEVFWVVLADYVVVHGCGKGFRLADQHDQKGLTISILVGLLKLLLIHYYDFLYFRPIFVLGLDVGSIVTCIEEKLVLVC